MASLMAVIVATLALCLSFPIRWGRARHLRCASQNSAGGHAPCSGLSGWLRAPTSSWIRPPRPQV